MTIPSSTYRLQFRNGMTFERAVALVPYLKSLAISHLYASPIFTATSGSTHGYDVTDTNEIDPAIGGRSGFDKLARALREAEIGLIIDIVPNHMAASLENAWWRDVVRKGPKSRYASYFDIDWSEPLTLPLLGQSFEQAVAAGEIAVVPEENGGFAFAYFEHRFPLSEETSASLHAETGGEPAALEALARDAHRMQALHDRQYWRLLFWKEASRHLSYRRFFEVTGLVGLRVEDEEVFSDSHRLTLDLVREGLVQGLRIDHIDGLADPAGYLDRLRAAVGPDLFITIEKILGHDETLPPSWPIAGTTGYEFIAALPDVFVDAEGLKALDGEYRAIAGDIADFESGLVAAKSLMATVNFAGEVARLVRIAGKINARYEDEAIAGAVRALLVAFPVYRTYGFREVLDDKDKSVLARVAAHARRNLPDPSAVDFLVGLLSDAPTSDEAFEFRTRFQQLSGPVMAKAMEDTFFYRYNRLLATNEVGGEPQEAPRGADGFHRAMQSRAKHQPLGLSASSTHDTKRGEDARARLYALSEGADIWNEAVKRWRHMNAGDVTILADGPAPEPNVEWMLYQALAGIWPEDMQAVDTEQLTKRFLAYVEKALREAKLRSDWAEENTHYEKSVKRYASALLSPHNMSFTEDFGTTLRPFTQAGYLNSLSQTVLKLMAPGIPDIYQGAEGLDFSLVDPDNRRDIDFGHLERTLGQATPVESLPIQDLKQRIIAVGLQFRKAQAPLFANGSYAPLKIEGERASHALAFARTSASNFVITIVPRLMFGKLEEGALFANPDFWGNTKVILHEVLTGAKRDLVTQRRYEGGDALALSAVLGRQPVAMLASV